MYVKFKFIRRTDKCTFSRYAKIRLLRLFPSETHTVPEVKNCKTPGKPYLLNYCIECNEIWFCNVFLGVLPCLRFSIWSDELFLQLLKVAFFSQSDHTIGFCEKFPWIWKKINFLRPTVQKLWLFEVFSLERV